MQLLIIAGTVGKDATLRQTSNDEVLGFSLAVNNGKDKDGNERPPTWYDCSLWGKRAASLQRHIVKGTKLTLSGRPTTRAHEGKAYLGISVDELHFGGSAGNGGGGQRSEERKPAAPVNNAGSGGRPTADFDGDDIPFAPEWR